MQTIEYLRYFVYLAYNWNTRIAWHITRRDMRGEKKYGIETTGADELKHLEKKGVDISHATIYMPASYDLLETVFAWLKDKHLEHLLDIGSGKGRAMCVAAHFGFKKVTGIELSPEFCKLAKLNLAKTKLKFPELEYNVVSNDAFYYELPGDVDCIFMFNPFDELIMSEVARRIERHRKSLKKDLYIVYLNPLHKSIFLKQGYHEVYYSKKLNYLEASVLKKKR